MVMVMVTSYNLFSYKWQGTPKGTLGMAGSESSPASLFQVYVDYGRYADATNLVLHYLESVASLVCLVYEYLICKSYNLISQVIEVMFCKLSTLTILLVLLY